MHGEAGEGRGDCGDGTRRGEASKADDEPGDLHVCNVVLEAVRLLKMGMTKRLQGVLKAVRDSRIGKMSGIRYTVRSLTLTGMVGRFDEH